MCRTSAQCGSDPLFGTFDCVCSSGVENLGQCVLNNCQKQQRSLMDCLNPLYFDPYANASSYQFVLPPQFAWLDSQSSLYTKCQGKHNDWVRCQGMMAKWGAPSVGLGDLINYDLSTISASSTVSASITVMVAFIMSVFLLL
jgi:hypothetical protein